MKKKTLILGASLRPDRYSFMALKLLTSLGHPVVAIGNKAEIWGDVVIHTHPVQESGIDTVTVYLGPQHQPNYYDYVLSLKPKRVIFNPGTENPDWENMLQLNGIQVVIACTLVMLQTGQY